MAELLGRKKAKPDAPLPLPPPNLVVEHYRNTGQNGPSLEFFRVDYDGGPRSSWNLELADVFADKCIKDRLYGWTEDNYDELRNHFITHLKTVIAHYHRQQSDPRRLSMMAGAGVRNRQMRRVENVGFRLTELQRRPTYPYFPSSMTAALCYALACLVCSTSSHTWLN